MIILAGKPVLSLNRSIVTIWCVCYFVEARRNGKLFLLNFIFKLIKTLRSKGEPHNIAMGFALGTIIGLTPSLALHNLIVFILVLIFNISLPAALFAVFFFSCFAHFFDPLFHSMGYFLLVKTEPLQPVWTYLYNIPIAPLTRFYNTVVLGSLVASLALFFPVYWGFKQDRKSTRLNSSHVRIS